ncbi:hypothetical protein DN068_12345 [Taibaiella soli]|uniref:Uncharacterized protein n=2 Tax=Taibaiella soli TaxID=1649169 RepID=A0A2W2B8N7_9BACT|nr:hypothetical protein DN068_12345 [Taibaiella soli]
MEADGQFIRWTSNYAPTLDVRFAREVKRIDDIPVKKLPKKTVFDEGTYEITKSDTKESAEQKFIESIDQKTFSFILHGEKLKGRFAFKKVVGGTVLQKYKDKYAIEEDVLMGDLSRTINTMIPDYDEKKVKLPGKKQTRKAVPHEAPPTPELPTPGNGIENEYDFTFYRSNNEPDICVVTDESGAVCLLKKENDNWVLLQPITRISPKKQEALTAYIGSLPNRKKK